MRADEPDLLPWMPEPDEPEIRQAVQRIEEPLRRLTDELFWFWPEHDPDGDVLRRALVSLDPALVDDYLARCADDGLACVATVSVSTDTVSSAVTDALPPANGVLPANGHSPSETTPAVVTAGVPRLLNHANLRLLLAALSLYDGLPEGPSAGTPLETDERAPSASSGNGRTACRPRQNPHELFCTGRRPAPSARTTLFLWSEALARWNRLANSPEFLAFVHENIARLDDEVVGPEDAETIVEAARTRLADLVVAEVKAQFLAGRMDRVRELLEAAQSSGIDPRRWSLALRPLRSLFRTEAAELDALLPAAEPRFDDIALYLSRLRAKKLRWESIDPAGHLGLAEVGDEAVVKACASLGALESYAAVDRLKPLFGSAMSLAAADSLKQRIATNVARLNSFENYACHFCRTREMDLNRSVVVTGKRESHRTYGFNSTTVHYMIKANVIPRCPRCSELHSYLWNVTGAIRAALAVAFAASLVFLIWAKPFGDDVEPIVYIVAVAAAAATAWMAGLLARWALTLLATPSGRAPLLAGQVGKAIRRNATGGLQDVARLPPERVQTFQGRARTIGLAAPGRAS